MICTNSKLQNLLTSYFQGPIYTFYYFMVAVTKHGLTCNVKPMGSSSIIQERKKNDITKLRQSRNFEAKENQDSNQGSKSPTGHIKKVFYTSCKCICMNNQVAGDLEFYIYYLTFFEHSLEYINLVLQIPVTRPQSPKLGRKSASSSTVQNNISSLPPKRPSVTSNDSKSVVRKRYDGTTQSVTSFGKKMNGCENFSPNIQS